MSGIDWGAVLTEEWGPPLISIVVGGMVASLLLPRLQTGFNRSRLFEQKRMEAMERVAETFPAYIANWRRLMTVAQAQRAAPPQDADAAGRLEEMKLRFADQRNACRDELAALIARARLYFSDDVASLLDEFLRWDERHAQARLEDLPQPEDWRKWELKLLEAMRSEALPPRRRGR